MKSFLIRWSVAFQVLPLIIAVLGLKTLVHYAGWEFLIMNSLFSGLITANVFLLGFLLADVLTDYKEGEKLPGELAAALELIFEEASNVYQLKQAAVARELQEYTLGLAGAIQDWLHRRITTVQIMANVSGLNEFFLQLEPLTPLSYIHRARDAQHAIRRMLIRIRSIREESFLSVGTSVGIAVSFFTIIGLLLTTAELFEESLFLIGLISFFIIYLLTLIRILENPFDYSDSESESGIEEISLKPLGYVQFRMRAHLGTGVDGEKGG